MSRGWKLDSRQVAYLETNDRLRASALAASGSELDQGRSEAYPGRISGSRGLTKIEQEGSVINARRMKGIVQLPSQTLQGSGYGERATSQVYSEALGQMARGSLPVTGDDLLLGPTLFNTSVEAVYYDEDLEESPRHTAGAF